MARPLSDGSHHCTSCWHSAYASQSTCAQVTASPRFVSTTNAVPLSSEIVRLSRLNTPTANIALSTSLAPFGPAGDGTLSNGNAIAEGTAREESRGHVWDDGYSGGVDGPLTRCSGDALIGVVAVDAAAIAAVSAEPASSKQGVWEDQAERLEERGWQSRRARCTLASASASASRARYTLPLTSSLKSVSLTPVGLFRSLLRRLQASGAMLSQPFPRPCSVNLPSAPWVPLRPSPPHIFHISWITSRCC